VAHESQMQASSAAAPCDFRRQKLREIMIQHDKLLIIDFGSQVTQLIARRLRELNVYCEIHPFNKVDAAFLLAFGPKAVILSGGPASVYQDDAPMPPVAVFDLGVPVLGICYGQQVMMHLLGGKVEGGHLTAEFGPHRLPYPRWLV
jgi:GMP synthase (glutamine-hydrolysing)